MGGNACSRVRELAIKQDMKLDILHVAIPPFLTVVGCTPGCHTEIPTRARICDR